MRAPLAWVGEFAQLPDNVSPRAVADALVRVGLEIERVETPADAISGPLVVGRVVEFADEPQKNGKTIRWCQVDVGGYEPRGIVCGASNFVAGDLVVVALPGTVLPGGFEISARRTYGHVSDGMICSARELGIGEDHHGILVLASGVAEPGADAVPVLGLGDAVLDMAVTPDRGYCLAIRGIAREAAIALDVAFRDLELELPPVDGRAYEITIDDLAGCDRFSARAVTGLDPSAPTPEWIARRLRQCGMRPISLAVDVANYVMLETGQPLHTFDQRKLTGPIGVRRARSGEKLLTLDGVARALDPDDLVVTDDSGPIALAGVMGGASTEISESTTDVLIEAAHWDPGSIARAARRHKLPSEAAKRFERGVDPEVAGIALQRCVDLLVAHGGARAATGFTVVGERRTAPLIALRVDRPGALAGMAIDREAVVSRLQQVGCVVEGGDVLQVAPPPWRPDLTDPADLIEEVVRLEGYERIPSTLPTPPSGRGLTDRQRLHRAVSRALAASGCLEVLSYPFVAPTVHDAFALPADDDRRRALRLANPLSDAEPELRTSLLPGLLAALARNVGRGNRDLAIYESGSVFLPRSGAPRAPRPRVDGRPSEEELAALDAALPDQPRHVAAAFCGDREPAGWWGPARAFDWSDAVAAAQTVAHAAGVRFSVRAADHAPWHPGRCAALELDGRLVGFAGELHPRVVSALSLPERTCAMELDLELLPPTVAAHAPHLSTYPPVLLDVALVVAADVAAGDIADVLRRGAGPLLEGLRLFDVYADPERVGAGHKSLAFAMTFRASDRTLTLEEATAARDAAVAAAAERYGAALRT